MEAVGVAPLQRFFSSLIRIGIRERSFLRPGSGGAGRPNPLSRISDREAEAKPSPKVRPLAAGAPPPPSLAAICFPEASRSPMHPY